MRVAVTAFALLLVLLAQGSLAQGPEQTLAIGAAGLLEELERARMHNRTEPVTYRKAGAWPPMGEVQAALVGALLFKQAFYKASFLGQLTDDVTDWQAQRFPRSTRLFKMVNSKFCTPTGTKCFVDADRDGDFDRAAIVGGKVKDAPYTVTELRAEEPGVREIHLMAVAEQGARCRFTEGNTTADCLLAMGQNNCAGVVIDVLKLGAGAMEYRIVR